MPVMSVIVNVSSRAVQLATSPAHVSALHTHTHTHTQTDTYIQADTQTYKDINSDSCVVYLLLKGGRNSIFELYLN